MALGRHYGVSMAVALAWALLTLSLTAQTAQADLTGKPILNPGAIAAASTTSGKTAVIRVVRKPKAPATGWLAATARGAESDAVFHFSQGLLMGAAAFDESATAAGLSHPSMLRLTIPYGEATRTAELDFSGRFAEGGWARAVSVRNPWAVCATYAAADALLAVTARRLARRGGRWRLLASASLLGQAAAHFIGGSTWVGLPGRVAAPYAGYQPVWVR